MFGFPLLIVLAAALVATGFAALGLSLFFRLLEPTSSAPDVSAGKHTPGAE